MVTVAGDCRWWRSIVTVDGDLVRRRRRRRLNARPGAVLFLGHRQLGSR
jgi:hypothetical protein